MKKKMVFKFLKKLFDGDKSEPNKNGTNNAKVAGSSEQETHALGKEVASLGALSGNNIVNHVDADTALMRNLEKWKHLLHSFVDCKLKSL